MTGKRQIYVIQDIGEPVKVVSFLTEAARRRPVGDFKKWRHGVSADYKGLFFSSGCRFGLGG